MKANELIEEIHAGNIENGTVINMYLKNELIFPIIYEYNTLLVKGTKKLLKNKYLCDLETDFEIIENNNKKNEVQSNVDVHALQIWIDSIILPSLDNLEDRVKKLERRGVK